MGHGVLIVSRRHSPPRVTGRRRSGDDGHRPSLAAIGAGHRPGATAHSEVRRRQRNRIRTTVPDFWEPEVHPKRIDQCGSSKHSCHCHPRGGMRNCGLWNDQTRCQRILCVPKCRPARKREKSISRVLLLRCVSVVTQRATNSVSGVGPGTLEHRPCKRRTWRVLTPRDTSPEWCWGPRVGDRVALGTTRSGWERPVACRACTPPVSLAAGCSRPGRRGGPRATTRPLFCCGDRAVSSADAHAHAGELIEIRDECEPNGLRHYLR